MTEDTREGWRRKKKAKAVCQEKTQRYERRRGVNIADTPPSVLIPECNKIKRKIATKVHLFLWSPLKTDGLVLNRLVQ